VSHYILIRNAPLQRIATPPVGGRDVLQRAIETRCKTAICVASFERLSMATTSTHAYKHSGEST